MRPNIDVEITREPVGIVGLITPWNFPMAIPAWKIAPALAYGNSVVFKPADLVPGCAWALADILSRSGLPHGGNSQAGMVMVNLPTAGVDYHVPFGGSKGSSYGPREQGRYAVEFYTTVKTAHVYPGSP